MKAVPGLTCLSLSPRDSATPPMLLLPGFYFQPLVKCHFLREACSRPGQVPLLVFLQHPGFSYACVVTCEYVHACMCVCCLVPTFPEKQHPFCFAHRCIPLHKSWFVVNTQKLSAGERKEGILPDPAMLRTTVGFGCWSVSLSHEEGESQSPAGGPRGTGTSSVGQEAPHLPCCLVSCERQKESQEEVEPHLEQ